MCEVEGERGREMVSIRRHKRKPAFFYCDCLAIDFKVIC